METYEAAGGELGGGGAFFTSERRWEFQLFIYFIHFNVPKWDDVQKYVSMNSNNGRNIRSAVIYT